MPKVNREELLAVLESLSPGLSPKGVLEQSTCFCFLDGYAMTFNGEVCCRMPFKPLATLKGAVQGASMLAVLRKMIEDELDVSQKDNEIVVSGQGRSAGVTMEAEFLLPVGEVEKPGKGDWVDVAPEFSEALGMAQECAGNDLKQYTTYVVHIHPQWVEAFDTFQMLRYTIKTGLKKPTSVKRDAIKQVAAAGVVQVAVTDSWMHFRTSERLVISCRRILDEFFDLSGEVKLEGQKVSLPKGLAAASELAEHFSSENKDANVVTVDLRPGKLRLLARGVSGWYKEFKELPYKGKPMSFMIFPKLLKQVVSKHNTCLISNDRLRVDGGKWVYSTVLGVPANGD